jgi:hypothetical protein
MDREQFLPIVRRNGDFEIEIEERKLEEIMDGLELAHRFRISEGALLQE